MIKFNWILEDCEKNRILGMHKNATKNHYLNEQSTKIGEKETTNQKTISLDKKTFPAGLYSINNLGGGKQDLDAKLQEIAIFAKENDGTQVSIQIEVGESKVTNYDNELKKPLQQGMLAKLRGEKLQQYLIGYFKGLVEQGYLKVMPTIPKPKTNVELGTQKHEYTRGIDNPKDPKYTEDQYVKFEINLVSTKKENIYECLVDLIIDVSYYHQKDKNFPCRGGHHCDDSIFEIYLDTVLLGVANLNNFGCESKLSSNPNACNRTAKFKVTNETVNKIVNNPNWNQKTLVLYTNCRSESCHTSIQEVRIVNNSNEVVYHKCVNPQSVRGNNSQKILAVLDRCGKPVEGSIDDNVSPDEVKMFSDQMAELNRKKISEIITNQGLIPLPQSSVINLFKVSAKKLQLSNITSDKDYVTISFKCMSPIDIGYFNNPLGGKKPYKHRFNTGDVVKIKYPISKVQIPNKKLQQNINSGILVKIPEFNGYLVIAPSNDQEYKLMVNSVVIPSNSR